MALSNFPISGWRMPLPVIHALGTIKHAMALANGEQGLIPQDVSTAIAQASKEIAEGKWDSEFPVDIFQTGSGTSTHMNGNEVLASRASALLGREINSHDEVNRGQSSNDVMPSSIQVAVVLSLTGDLIPATDSLVEALESLSHRAKGIVKTGRTHLMDALPILMSDEIDAWKEAIGESRRRLRAASFDASALPLGGTAVGNGVNGDPQTTTRAFEILSEETGVPFRCMESPFRGLSLPNSLLAVSSSLRDLAIALFKISNDLRWMNSGPKAGIGEIELPKLQPGSSIMPGKVNPVIPEAVAQVAAQVIGNDATVSWAVASGNFQLNVMFPLISKNLLEPIHLLSRGMDTLRTKALETLSFRKEQMEEMLWRNPILATALNPHIGYEAAAEIAGIAYAENRSVLEVAMEKTELGEERLRALMNPSKIARGPSAP